MLADARWIARSALYDSDVAFRVAARLSSRFTLPSESTDVVIEGFPRSANTYVALLVHVHFPELRYWSHSHGSAAVAAGHRLDIPTVLLVREPVDCVASLMVREGLSAGAGLYWYRHFHRRVWRYRHGLRLLPFPTAVNEPEVVVAAFADLLCCEARSVDSDSLARVRELVVEVEARSTGKVDPARVAMPHPEREADLGRAQKLVTDQHPKLLSDCRALWRKWQTVPHLIDKDSNY